MDKTVAEIAKQYEVHPTQITDWRRHWLKRAADVFGGATAPSEPPLDLKALDTARQDRPAGMPT